VFISASSDKPAGRSGHIVRASLHAKSTPRDARGEISDPVWREKMGAGTSFQRQDESPFPNENIGLFEITWVYDGVPSDRHSDLHCPSTDYIWGSLHGRRSFRNSTHACANGARARIHHFNTNTKKLTPPRNFVGGDNVVMLYTEGAPPARGVIHMSGGAGRALDQLPPVSGARPFNFAVCKRCAGP